MANPLTIHLDKILDPSRAVFSDKGLTDQVRARCWIAFFGAIAIFACLSMRLCWVTLCFGKKLRHTSACHKVLRADILDRNGLVLSTSIPVFSVYAHPGQISSKKEAAHALHSILPDISIKKLYQMLCQDRTFVWIARHISPENRLKIQALGIEGIGLIKEQKRLYPHGRSPAHILGLTNIDQEGTCGIEKSFNAQLSEGKKTVSLSIDIRFQHMIGQHLKETIDLFQAKGGNALLVDMNTGEVLAMVSLPDFCPNKTRNPNHENCFNRNTMGAYEFGSIMKVFNVAMVLEEKVATLDSIYDASAPLQVGRFKITDFRGQNRPLTVRESFVFSSNIANALMALDAGLVKQVSFFKKIGLLANNPVELPEYGRPILPKKWDKTSLITASYGYGFAITPVQLIRSFCTVITGRSIPLTILRTQNQKDPPVRTVSDSTSRKIVELLGLAVQKGQAQRARSQICTIGAKTGTANRCSAGTYREKNNLTSCVAIFPLERPRYILLVSIDQAKPNEHSNFYATAGWIAAPLIPKIIDSLAPLLGLINPDSPSLEESVDHLLTEKGE